MEYFAIFAAAVAASSAKMQIFFILLAGLLLLYVAMVFACLRELNRWGRDMDKRAARWERKHQEHMIASMMRREEHEEFMKRIDARGRSRPLRPRRSGP